jgi:hypothetical protein
MPRSPLAAVLALCLTLMASSALAQSSATSQAQPSGTSQASSSTPQPKPDQPASQEKPAPKKVWTNDDINSASGPVSVVGDPSKSAARRDARNRAGHRIENNSSAADSFRSQLIQLQIRLDAINKEINQLRSFKAENTSPSQGIRLETCCSPIPIADQIRQLETKREQVRAQIDSVEDRARKAGLEPGQLRFEYSCSSASSSGAKDGTRPVTCVAK